MSSRNSKLRYYAEKLPVTSHAGMPELLRPHYPLKQTASEDKLEAANVTVKEATPTKVQVSDEEAGVIIINIPIRKPGYVPKTTERENWDIYQKRMEEAKNSSLNVTTTPSTFIKVDSKDNLTLSDNSSENMTDTVTHVNKCDIEVTPIENNKMVISEVNKMENSIIEPDTTSVESTELHQSDIIPGEDVKLQQLDSNITIPDIIDVVKKLTKSKTKKGDFKMTSMRILLTYQGVDFDKLEIFNYISSILTKNAKIIEDYLIVHEKYEEQYHTHIYIKLNEALRIGRIKMFDFKSVRPNIEKLLYHKSYLDNLFSYFFDKDINPHTNLSIDRLQELTVNPKVQKIELKLKDIHVENKIITKKVELTSHPSHNLKDNNIKRMEEWEFKPWQRFLLNVVEGDVDKSKFYWCWEPFGEMGKTQLTNYISTNYKNVLVIKTLDTYLNMLNTYLNVIKTREIKTVILDLSRKMSDILLNSTDSGVFDFIQTLKESFVNDINISNETVTLIPCHVIVFSNCIIGIKEISPSKWRIIKILEDGEACMGSVNRKSEIEYESVHI